MSSVDYLYMSYSKNFFFFFVKIPFLCFSSVGVVPSVLTTTRSRTPRDVGTGAAAVVGRPSVWWSTATGSTFIGPDTVLPDPRSSPVLGPSGPGSCPRRPFDEVDVKSRSESPRCQITRRSSGHKGRSFPFPPLNNYLFAE